MKKLFFLLLFFTVVAATAHEFWLQPSLFICKPGDTVTVSFFVGENFTGEYWGREKNKINTLRHFATGIEESVADAVSGDKVDSLKIVLTTPGTHLLAFNSNNSFIELNAGEFNAYLKEDGLYNTIKYREKHNETHKAGTEYYQRSVKALLQCGTVKDTIYKKNTGLPLEITPLKHPYRLTKQSSIPFQITFNRSPLADALVKVWHKMPGRKATLFELHTDAKGRIKPIIKPKGTWLISSVHMIPNSGDTKAQWQSYWGSFCFGY